MKQETNNKGTNKQTMIKKHRKIKKQLSIQTKPTSKRKQTCYHDI